MKEPVIELRLWRQFLAVAEELHFGRAAARLHMTQPPLTQAVAQLERLLGVRLFDRTKRSVRLTAAGDALVAPARELLARAQSLPEQARAAAAGEVGRLLVLDREAVIALADELGIFVVGVEPPNAP